MTAVDRLADCIGGAIGENIRLHCAQLRDVRIRPGREAALNLMDGSEIRMGAPSAEEMRRMIARMTEDSLYACEDELKNGYFTMAGGIRVGVCGRMNAGENCVRSLANIGSLCIRIPRQVKNCAKALVQPGRPENMLIISPPGMGKTTMIRDIACLVSESGWNVAIADERREIAACREGIPTFDVGKRTDVMDGCPKAIAIFLLLRACAPDLIVADEIGSAEDGQTLREARRMGAAVVASAHAASFRDAEARFGSMLGEVFSKAVLLGPTPGKILEIRDYSCEGANDAEGFAADHCVYCLRGCRKDAFRGKAAQGGGAG